MNTPPARIKGLAAVLSLNDCDLALVCRGRGPMVIAAAFPHQTLEQIYAGEAREVPLRATSKSRCALDSIYESDVRSGQEIVTIAMSAAGRTRPLAAKPAILAGVAGEVGL